MDIEIKDNFLAVNDLENLNDILTENSFPWYCNKTIADKNDKGIVFFHELFNSIEQKGINSSYFNICEPILKKINIKKLIRVRINLFPRTHKKIKHGWHVDWNFDHKVAIFYLNTNNGETHFEQKNVPSKANTCCFFDGSLKHRSVNQSDELQRINFNINYL